MTSVEYRSERSRCAALRRLLEMPTVQKAIEAVFEDLSMTEAYLINKNLDASPNLELRLQNTRKGHWDFLNALKLMCEPIGDAPSDPKITYGEDEAAAKLEETGWSNV